MISVHGAYDTLIYFGNFFLTSCPYLYLYLYGGDPREPIFPNFPLPFQILPPTLPVCYLVLHL